MEGNDKGRPLLPQSLRVSAVRIAMVRRRGVAGLMFVSWPIRPDLEE